MRHFKVMTSAVVALASAVAPLNAQLPPDRPTPQPSVALPADLDRVLRDYERYWRAGEEGELAALFVETGLIVSQGSWIRGRDAIQEAYRDFSGPLQLRAVEYATNDDLGYIVGAYGYGEDPPADDRGLFVLTLRRSDSGRWLIVSDMDRGAN